MLTQAQVLEAVRHGRSSDCIDGRDYARLAEFFPVEELATFGLTLKADAGPWEQKPWSETEVMKQLAEDVAFGFEKALRRRGISSGLMHSTVRMWLWVLEDPLQHDQEYAQYGLPLFKKAAVKYGFPNPIGDDRGDEYRYSEHGE